jgi:acyl-CoA reductase-like NAD-dependent aldehyde dehydrogenase
MQSFPMLIDGQLVQTPEQDNVINPAQAAPFATCARASKAHVDQAVAAARARIPDVAHRRAFRRQKLNECAAAIQGRVNDIAMLLVQEQGKPLGKAIEEIFGASFWFSYFAGLEIKPEIIQDDDTKRIQVVHKPLGVVAAITPWNFPVILLSFKFGPALLAGNTIVAKPSEYTPLSSLLVAEILKDLHDAVRTLRTEMDLSGDSASHPTSARSPSPAASRPAEDRQVLRRTARASPSRPAATTRRSSSTTSIRKIVGDIFNSAFANSGQVCTAIKRLYEKVYAPILDGLIERAKAAVDAASRKAPSTAPSTTRCSSIASWASSRTPSGRIVAGGKPSTAPLLPPSDDRDRVGPGIRLVDEEQFGTAPGDQVPQPRRCHRGGEQDPLRSRRLDLDLELARGEARSESGPSG